MRQAQTSAATGRPVKRLGIARLLVHGYAILVAAGVLALICSGGLVTSKGVGLSVPDWPTTYGYNMFAFPISRWVGGVLYEHAHRLIASGVGLLTVGLAVALWRVDPRRWMGRLGLGAVAAVCFQGLLGGLRVITPFAWRDQIGIFHACLAQAVLLLLAFIALATSRWWHATPAAGGEARRLARMFLVVAALIYGQLALGATMRHQHAGLAIRDFPTAYGRVWPRLDEASLVRINQERIGSLALPPTSAAQIVLQMLHRMGAAVISMAVLTAAWLTWQQRRGLSGGLLAAGLLGPGLIALQVTAGIYTIWTNKAADVATTHVALGALSLVWAGLTAVALNRAGAVVSPVVAPAARLAEAGV